MPLGLWCLVLKIEEPILCDMCPFCNIPTQWRYFVTFELCGNYYFAVVEISKFCFSCILRL